MYASGNICNATGKLPQKQFVMKVKSATNQVLPAAMRKSLPVSPPSRQYLLHFFSFSRLAVKAF